MIATLPSLEPPSMTTTSRRGYRWRKMLSSASGRNCAWLYEGTTTLIRGNGGEAMRSPSVAVPQGVALGWFLSALRAGLAARIRHRLKGGKNLAQGNALGTRRGATPWEDRGCRRRGSRAIGGADPQQQHQRDEVVERVSED